MKEMHFGNVGRRPAELIACALGEATGKPFSQTEGLYAGYDIDTLHGTPGDTRTLLARPPSVRQCRHHIIHVPRPVWPLKLANPNI